MFFAKHFKDIHVFSQTRLIKSAYDKIQLEKCENLKYSQDQIKNMHKFVNLIWNRLKRVAKIPRENNKKWLLILWDNYHYGDDKCYIKFDANRIWNKAFSFQQFQDWITVGCISVVNFYLLTIKNECVHLVNFYPETKAKGVNKWVFKLCETFLRSAIYVHIFMSI